MNDIVSAEDWPETVDEWPDDWGDAPPILLNTMQLRILEALFHRDPIISARAGWGSGKTSALVFAMIAISHLVPGGTTPVVTDTRPRYDRVLHPAISRWCKALGWTWHERLMTWTDPSTGSKFVVVPYYKPDTRSDTHNPLEGLDGDSGFAIVDECQALPAEVAAKLTGRIRSGPDPVRIFMGLPVDGAWWIALAVKRGCEPIYSPSSVNRANLGRAWLDDARETLSEEEYEAMVLNKPIRPTGQVYHEWLWQRWPAGNLAPEWWCYDPSMRTVIAIDPGVRKPSVLLIAHDDDPRFGEGGADIIVGEFNPLRLTVSEIVGEVLKVAWPRSQAHLAPDDRIWIDEGVIDKAGRNNTRDNDLRSTAEQLERAVAFGPDGEPKGGIGVEFAVTTDPERVWVPAGIQRVKRLICHYGQRRLLCSEEVYQGGLNAGATRNSLVRALAEYTYPQQSDSSSEEPKKSGIEDPLDALRYWAIMYHWDFRLPYRRPMHGMVVAKRKPLPGGRR